MLLANELAYAAAAATPPGQACDGSLKAAFVSKALPLTAEFTGLNSFKALCGVENVDSIMFLAEWESVEAHLASRPEPAHEAFRQIVLPYTAGAKQTVHFSPV